MQDRQHLSGAHLILVIGHFDTALAQPLDLGKLLVARQIGNRVLGFDPHHLVARHSDQFLRRLVRDQLAMVDDGDTLAQFLGLFEVVCGQHHGNAFAVEFGDQLPQLTPQFDVDARGRFIQHEDRRRMHHRLGDQKPPLHPARQRARIGIALVRQPHRLEQFLAPPQRLGNAIEPALIFQHLEWGEERVEHDFLRDNTDGTARIAALLIDVEAPDIGRTAGLVHQSGEDIDQRRFARTIGAEQAEDRSFGHIEADTIERQLALAALALGRRVAFDQIIDADGGCVRHGADP